MSRKLLELESCN